MGSVSLARVPGRGGRTGWTALAGRTVLAGLAGGCAAVLAVGAPAHAGAGPGGTAAGVISTLAGGPGGPGAARKVAVSPCGIRVTGTTLYVANYATVQQVSTATGQLTTVAGNGASEANEGGGNGAAATKVSLTQACGTAVDAAGNLIVASGDVVQVVAAKTGTFYGQHMTAGHIYIVAGRPGWNRADASPGDGGPATSGALSDATGVSVDAAGNLVIADSGAQQDCGDCSPVAAVVRLVAAKTGTFYGQHMTAGDIYDIAGSYNPGGEGNTGPALHAYLGVAIGSVRPDAAGNLIIPDNGEDDLYTTIQPSVRVVAARTGTFYGRHMTAGHIYRVAGNHRGGGSGDGGPALKAGLDVAGDAAVDAAGNLVIADGYQVRVVAARTGTFYGRRMTARDIYDVAGSAKAGYSGDGGPATQAEVNASNVAVDSSGNIVLSANGRIRVTAERTGTFYGEHMTPGDIYTVAGDGMFHSASGTPAAKLQIRSPAGAATDTAGDVLTTDNESDCLIWLEASHSGRLFGRAVTAGDFYQVGGTGTCGYSGDGGPATRARFSFGAVASFDHWGNVAVADATNNRIRIIAAQTGTFYGQHMVTGDVYTIAGSGAYGFSGDGGPATAAKLAYPGSASPDQAGNLLVTDGSNHRIRVIAATTGTFYGQHMTTGDIYTIAGDGNYKYSGDGGPATAAGMDPDQAVTDAAGNIVVADGANFRVRVIAATTGTFYGQHMTTGDIYTIAGSGSYGFSGNGGPATAADLAGADGVAVDSHGNVAIDDTFNNVVWVAAEQNGTFYGQHMTTGHIYIVAGNGASLGTDGLGDGGPATEARLDFPAGVAVTPAGDLLITVTLDNRVRRVAG